VNHECKRADWSTYGQFEDMYTQVYQRWLDEGYAEVIGEPEFQDLNGGRVEPGSPDAYGSAVQYRLKYPELIVVGDEVGTNTDQSKEKHVGGERLICAVNEQPNISCTTDDCHFTTIGFTALTGEPVMVVIIIEKNSELIIPELMGFDKSARWEGSDQVRTALAEGQTDHLDPEQLAAELKDNMGPGKMFPGGPTCMFKGKEVPAFVTHSSSGGITSDILAERLKRMDDAGIFPRAENIPAPFALLDGHGSRLQLPFLRYISNQCVDHQDNCTNHSWNASLGSPNNTGYWQVGDSLYQNGRFKISIYKGKRLCVLENENHSEKTQLKRTDIVLLVNAAFTGSFGDVEGNKKAIAERGWCPLNYGCLVMPEIAKTKPGRTSESQDRLDPDGADYWASQMTDVELND
jgi:hypothetical protein